MVCQVFSTTESCSDMWFSLRWAAVASLRLYRAIFWIFCLKTFKVAFLMCVGVRRSQFHNLRKVVSKNCSVWSCVLTLASCIQRSFSKQAYQTWENSGTNHKICHRKRVFFATLAKCSSRQTRTASSDCLHLVTEVNPSIYMISRKKDTALKKIYQWRYQRGDLWQSNAWLDKLPYSYIVLQQNPEMVSACLSF